MSRRIIIALSAGALALTFAGCGSDDKSGDSANTSTPTTANPATGTGTVNVVMQNNRFAPDKIVIKVGQKIHWVNNDSYPHNVTATKGDDFASKDVDGGGTFDYTADKAGTIDYVCTIHSGQTGKITVKQ